MGLVEEVRRIIEGCLTRTCFVPAKRVSSVGFFTRGKESAKLSRVADRKKQKIKHTQRGEGKM